MHFRYCFLIINKYLLGKLFDLYQQILDFILSEQTAYTRFYTANQC